MTAKSIRLLADSLERNFMTEEDRKGWVTALRGHANAVEWSVMLGTPLQFHRDAFTMCWPAVGDAKKSVDK